MKLTYMSLGHATEGLLHILRQLASEIRVSHIAYARIFSKRSVEGSLLTESENTYPVEWQRRYYNKKYFLIDPTIKFGRTSCNYFDWNELERESMEVKEFFLDSVRHKVGANGITIPVRNRMNNYALISFTSDMERHEWEQFKTENIDKLHFLSLLIDSAAMTGLKLEEASEVNLSLREAECLGWAARGKTYEEIGGIMNLSFHSVRNYLDVARHKLRGTNLTHAVALALALGVISPLEHFQV